jgi:glycosyltransferase involved in cell wall biosynthesis
MKIIFQNNFLNKLNKCEFKQIRKKFSEKISIVMPCYNQVEFIEKSILSVLNQDYKNIELIIIDGGSNDGTIEIIKKYQDYISFWVSEKDKGQSDALNKGFKLASVRNIWMA